MSADTSIRRRRFVRAAQVLLVAIVCLGTAAGASHLYTRSQDHVYRPEAQVLSAESPIASALALSRQVWDKSSAVVIVSEADAAGALAASSLAGALNAPVLLTEQGRLTPEIIERITEMGVQEVYLVGTTQTLSDEVVVQAEELAAELTNLRSSDAYAMSLAVAAEVVGLKNSHEIAIVPLAQAAETIPALPLLSGRVMPVLFAGDDGTLTVPADLVTSLAAESVLLLGSEASVNESSVKTVFTSALTRRVYEPTVGDLAVAISEHAFASGFSYERTYAVRGTDMAHAFALGPVAANTSSTLIVTCDDELGGSAASFLRAHASSISELVFLGPEGALDVSIKKDALDAAETRISANVILMDEDLAQSLLEVTADTVIVDKNAATESLRRGRVIVSGEHPMAPSGFLRRIVSVREDSGRYILGVEQASLTEVIVKGSLDARLSSQDASTTVGFNTGSQGRVVPTASDGAKGVLIPALYSPGDASVAFAQARPESETNRFGGGLIEVPWPKFDESLPTKSGGKVTVKVIPKETWRINMLVHGEWSEVPYRGWREVFGVTTESVLDEYKVFATLDHTFSLQLGFELGGSTSLYDVNKKRLSVDQIRKKVKDNTLKNPVDLPLETVVTPKMGQWVQVVWLPVYVSVDPTPYGKVDLGITGKFGFDISHRFALDLGFQYLREPTGDVTYIHELRASEPAFSLTFGGAIDVKPAIGIELAVKLYDAIGPYLKGGFYVKGVGEADLLTVDNAGPRLGGEASFTLSAGAEAGIGGKISIPGGDDLRKLESPLIEIPPFFTKTWPEPLTDPDAPPTGSKPEPDTGRGTLDLMVVCDNSGSMGYESAAGFTRIENARAAVTSVLDVLAEPIENDTVNRIGLVAFADDVVADQWLTTDFDVIERLAQHMEAAGGTGIEAGVLAAQAHLVEGKGQKPVIILISDGSPNRGASTFEQFNEPGGAIEMINKAGITLHTVGYGVPGNEYDPVFLQKLAEACGGRFFKETAAGDVGNSLARALVGIAEQEAGGEIIAEENLALDIGKPTRLTGFRVAAADEGKATEVRVMVGARDRSTDIWVVDPRGFEVTSETYPGLEIIQGRALLRFVIPSAIAGDYEVYAMPPGGIVQADEPELAHGDGDWTSTEEASFGDGTGTADEDASIGDGTGTAEQDNPKASKAGAFVVVSAGKGSSGDLPVVKPRASVEPRPLVPLWTWGVWSALGICLIFAPSVIWRFGRRTT